MDSIQVLTIVFSNLIFALFMVFRVKVMINAQRKESKEDWVRSQNTIESIRLEMKDFHERLLKIEMSRK